VHEGLHHDVPLVRGGVVVGRRLGPNRPEEVRGGESEEAEHLPHAVLHRRAREEEPEVALEGGEALEAAGSGVLEVVGLVDDDAPPRRNGLLRGVGGGTRMWGGVLTARRGGRERACGCGPLTWRQEATPSSSSIE